MRALRYAAKGEIVNAQSALVRAVDVAQPGGFVRLFVDLGPLMADLLASLPLKDSNYQGYVAQILSAFTGQHSPRSHTNVAKGQPQMTERLTDREMQVLTLLEKRRTDREIADALVISPNTVSTHTRNLFAKLGVHNRRQAVARARELGLLPSG